jgi:hypothetical protein
MDSEAREQRNVSLVSHHDLDRKPAFKIAIDKFGSDWFLYLANLWEPGWAILNVTDPANPTIERRIEGPPNSYTKQIQVADGLMITGYERPLNGVGPVDGPYYDPSEPHETGADIWDVSADPTNPERLSHYETGGHGTHRNYYAGGDYAYMCACPDGYTPDEFDGPNPKKNFLPVVVDVSDPANPVEVTRWTLPGQDPDDDVEPEATYFHGPAYVRGDRAYLSYGRGGCVILDVEDPTDPELVTRLNPGEGFGGFIGVHSFIPVPGTDLAVANTETNSEAPPGEPGGHPVSYTLLIDVSDERDPGYKGTDWQGPSVVSSMPFPQPEADAPYDSYYEKIGRFGMHNQHHPRGESTRLQSSEYIFMTYFNAGLRVFDISDPLVPTEAGYFVPTDPDVRTANSRPTTYEGLGSHLEDVLVDSRGYIYCTDPQQGLFILETDLL